MEICKHILKEKHGAIGPFIKLHNKNIYPLRGKYDILASFCKTKPANSKVIDNRFNKNTVYERCYFNTTVHLAFKLFADSFYKFDLKLGKWVKIIPKDIKELLTPRVPSRFSAYFYMDDGALKWAGHGKAMRICTENFSFVQSPLTGGMDLERFRRLY
jgi:hypothetical protein